MRDCGRRWGNAGWGWEELGGEVGIVGGGGRRGQTEGAGWSERMLGGGWEEVGEGGRRKGLGGVKGCWVGGGRGWMKVCGEVEVGNAGWRDGGGRMLGGGGRMLGGSERDWVERWGLWEEVGEGGRRKGLGGVKGCWVGGGRGWMKVCGEVEVGNAGWRDGGGRMLGGDGRMLGGDGRMLGGGGRMLGGGGRMLGGEVGIVGGGGRKGQTEGAGWGVGEAG